MTESTNQWFQESITSLLSAPGPLHIPKLPFGRRGGPGPIDLFSTRFANLFSDDVSAIVNGEMVDSAGLKDKLVILKRSFDPSTAAFFDVDNGNTKSDVSDDHERAVTQLTWRQTSAKGHDDISGTENEIIWDASFKVVQGNLRKIVHLSITTDLLSN